MKNGSLEASKRRKVNMKKWARLLEAKESIKIA